MKDPLFLIGLVLKLICLFCFVSEASAGLFIPFLDAGVQNPSANPWTLSPPSYFPYGGFLYLVLIIPKSILFFLFEEKALGISPLSIFALKFPLLIFDYLLFQALCDFAAARSRNLLWFYWLNPILFYITYVYGQLDLVSTAMVFFSIWALFKRKIIFSGLLLGLATATKFHVVSVIPVFLFYFWINFFRRESIRLIFAWTAPWLIFALLGFFPLIWAGNGEFASLGSPEVQRLLAAKIELGPSHFLYLGIVISLLVVGRVVISTRMSRLGFVMSVGSILTVLVLSSNSAPGWYAWTIPSLALFFALYQNVNRLLFWCYVGSYLLFFPVQQILGEDLNSLWGFLFTGLQTSLVANLIAIWIISLKNEAPVQNRTLPVFVGIAGDSGSGKSVATQLLLRVFGDLTTVIEGDNYHKWERGDLNWEKYTHLHPLANHLFVLSNHLRTMASGQTFLNKTYDHDTGKFTAPIEMRPSRTVLVQGLHSFYLKDMRDLFDLKIFMCPDPLLRKAWKINRDCNDRGYERGAVLKQIEKRAEDSKSFIDSQRQFADVIVEYFPRVDFSEERANQGDLPDLSIRLTTWNSIDFSTLIHELEREHMKVGLDIDADSLDRMSLSVESPPDRESIQRLCDRLFPSLKTLVRSRQRPELSAGFDGLLQLFLLWVFEHQRRTQIKKGAI